MTLNRPGSESTLGTYYNCYVGYSTSSGSPADTATGGWNSDTVIIAEKEEAEREHAPQHVPLQVMV
jgi:pectate lyase